MKSKTDIIIEQLRSLVAINECVCQSLQHLSGDKYIDGYINATQLSTKEIIRIINDN